jgi:uncharacterized protein (DUF2164 family)
MNKYTLEERKAMEVGFDAEEEKEIVKGLRRHWTTEFIAETTGVPVNYIKSYRNDFKYHGGQGKILSKEQQEDLIYLVLAGVPKEAVAATIRTPETNVETYITREKLKPTEESIAKAKEENYRGIEIKYPEDIEEEYIQINLKKINDARKKIEEALENVTEDSEIALFSNYATARFFGLCIEEYELAVCFNPETGEFGKLAHKIGEVKKKYKRLRETELNDEIKKLDAEGLDYKSIATRLHCESTLVSNRLKRLHKESNKVQK